jgi:hypothetical protein
MCVHLIDLEDPYVDIQKSCFYVGDSTQRIWSKSFSGVSKGDYIVWIDINEKVASQGVNVKVTGGLQDLRLR